PAPDRRVPRMGPRGGCGVRGPATAADRKQGKYGMSTGAMILSEIDTVAIALTDWPAGETRAGVTAVEEIKRGHKIARLPMAKGDPVIKYGQMMGIASEDIAVGAHVHTHNCGFPRDHAEMPAPRATAPEPPERRSFEGYLRPDGRVGTRNYIG